MTSKLSSNKEWFSKIKEIDVFGEQIIFTLAGKSTFKTYLGSLFTIFLTIIGIFMFFFMGQSFFFRTDPITTFSQNKYLLPPFYKTIDNNKLFIAVSFRTATNQRVLPDGTIYIINLYKVVTKTSGAATYTKLAMLPCKNMAGLDGGYIKQYKLKDFACFTLTDENWGGSVYDDGYTYFELRMDYCSYNSPICDWSRINVLDSATTLNYVDIWYPETYFDPNDVNQPLQVKHTFMSDTQMAKNYILREFYFKRTTLYDDVGWLLSDNHALREISTGQTNYRLINREQSKSDMQISRYYFYVGPIDEYYTRKYQKLQDVIAIVGGFLKICQTIMTFMLGYFIKYFKYNELMNGVINFKDDEVDLKLPTAIFDKSSMDSDVKKKFRQVSKQFVQYHKVNAKDITDSNSKSDETNYALNELLNNSDDSYKKGAKLNQDRKKEDIHSHYEVNNCINYKDENIFNSVPLKVLKDKREIKKNMNNPECNKIRNSANKKLSFSGLKSALTMREAKKKFRFTLTCSELIKKLLCRRFLSKKGLKRVKLYELAQDYLKEQLDIFGYFDIINETNKLKSILFDTNQSMCLKYIENPTIYVNNKNLEPDTIENLRLIIPTKTKIADKGEIHHISEYFAHQIYNKKLSYADKVLLMSLDEEILSETTLKLIRIMEKIKYNKTHLIKFDEVIEKNKKEDILDF